MCTVCAHADHAAIDAALVANEPKRRIAARFGVNESAIRRHEKAGHIATAMVKAGDAAEVADADALLEKCVSLEADARRIREASEKAGDLRTALAAVRELVRMVELLGRLAGVIDAHGVAVQVNGAQETVVRVEYGKDDDLAKLTADERDTLRALRRKMDADPETVRTVYPERPVSRRVEYAHDAAPAALAIDPPADEPAVAPAAPTAGPGRRRRPPLPPPAPLKPERPARPAARSHPG